MTQVLTFLFALISMSSCVGPTTPFGGTMSFESNSSSNRALASTPIGSKITFRPARQNLHANHQLQIIIKDKYADPKQLSIFYNDADITHLAEINVHHDGLTARFPKSKIVAGRENKVLVNYRGKWSNWKQPQCSIDAIQSILNTGSFEVSQTITNKIETISKNYAINPPLLAAIIAQESSFNPSAISWAKAIGLTQITNIADEDLKPHSRSWPRHHATRRYPATIVKGMILSGKINGKNEWRLDPVKSIEGGATYLTKTIDYWNKNPELLSRFSDKKLDIVLASYNSGRSRVKTAIKKNGDDFLDDLNAARHYVERIKSYCYHFSHEEDM